MCLLLLMYFIQLYIKQFLKYCDFYKWQGTFFDEYIFNNVQIILLVFSEKYFQLVLCLQYLQTLILTNTVNCMGTRMGVCVFFLSYQTIHFVLFLITLHGKKIKHCSDLHFNMFGFFCSVSCFNFLDKSLFVCFTRAPILIVVDPRS